VVVVVVIVVKWKEGQDERRINSREQPEVSR
jgi:hypothetical protein